MEIKKTILKKIFTFDPSYFMFLYVIYIETKKNFLNMKKILFFLGNIFRSGKPASDLHFKTYGTDHRVRINHYNTAGEFDDMLAATDDALEACFGEMDVEDQTKAIKKGKTGTVDKFFVDFKADMTLNEKIIGGQFLPDSETYIEFFPKGLTEYTIEMLLNRLKAAVTAHSTSFPPAFVTKLQGYITTYNNIRSTQLDKKEDVRGFILTTDELRAKLEKQITINIHTLAIKYIDEPEKAAAFFNQSLLNPSHHHPQGGTNTGPYVLDLPIGETRRADIEMVDEMTFFLLIKNNRTTPMYGYTSDHITGEPASLTPIVWQPAEEKIFSYAQMGGKPYLFFFTESTEIIGQVSIVRLGAMND